MDKIDLTKGVGLQPKHFVPAKSASNKVIGEPIKNNAFQNIFEEQIANIQFSKHASVRLNDRNINLSSEQLQRVESGIDNAKQKGINDSLVLVDNIALLVNIDSRTVITALNKEQKNIFTNIDGAVIV